METLWQNVKYGARMLLKSPAFTAVAVVTLALGIGVNTAIFSVLDGVLLRPLSYPDPDRVVSIWQRAPSTGFPRFGISEGQYEQFRDEMKTADTSAYHILMAALTGIDQAERIRIAHASVNTLATLGYQPVVGRPFRADEGFVGKNRVVLLSHGFWQRRFGGDPAVLGRQIKLNDTSYIVVGVLPAAAQLPADLLDGEHTELWMPEVFDPQNPNRWGSNYLTCVGRLRPGATVQQAEAEVATMARQIQQAHPEADIHDPSYAIRVDRLQEDMVGDLRTLLFVLSGAVGFVLLIACANVANLLLARAQSRSKEIAIRAALGAGRGQLVAQLLTECLLLAFLGGGLGCLLAWWGLDLFSVSLLGTLPRFQEVQLNGSVLLFATGVTVLTSVLFGLAPALQTTRLDLSRTLHEEGRTVIGGRSRHRAQRVLVVVQVALAVVLVVGAGLLSQSLYRLMRIDPGFRPENVLTMQIALSPTKYAESQQATNFFISLMDRIRALPQVKSVGTVNVPPLAGFGGDTVFDVEGRPSAQQQMKGPGGFAQHLGFRITSPGYFEAVGVRLIRGRTFNDFDRADGKQVTVINETMARRFWPNQEPLGQRIRLYRNPTETGPWMEIVGVVGDTKIRSLTEEAKQEIFMPVAQFGGRGSTLVVRVVGDPKALAGTAREMVRALDAEAIVFNVRTMEEILAGTVAQPRLNLILLGCFAALALTLAMVGVYGVISYTVSQRTHEIGVRMALGAQPRDVLRLILGQGMGVTLVGIGLGVAASFALTRLLSSLLYGVSATDLFTFVGVVLLLTFVGLLACYVPARRATRVDPMVALRYE